MGDADICFFCREFDVHGGIWLGGGKMICALFQSPYHGADKPRMAIIDRLSLFFDKLAEGDEYLGVVIAFDIKFYLPGGVSVHGKDGKVILFDLGAVGSDIGNLDILIFYVSRLKKRIGRHFIQREAGHFIGNIFYMSAVADGGAVISDIKCAAAHDLLCGNMIIGIERAVSCNERFIFGAGELHRIKGRNIVCRLKVAVGIIEIIYLCKGSLIAEFFDLLLVFAHITCDEAVVSRSGCDLAVTDELRTEK